MPHDTGATVSQYWDASDQLTLMQDDIVSDTGSYSVGFGFRLNITPEMRQDYYNGTIIFTLIPI